MRRGVVLLVAGMLSGGGVIASAATARSAEDLLSRLPEGPGKEETFYLCSACHSFRMVWQQGLSRDSWDETLDWMAEEQGMSELEGDERRLILDYLAANYGIDHRPVR